jgi:hypothetical protein
MHNIWTTEDQLERAGPLLLYYEAWVSNFVDLRIVLLILFFMQETQIVSTPPKSEDMFTSEHAWMVQCLSLAALGLLTYLHIAPMIA